MKSNSFLLLWSLCCSLLWFPDFFCFRYSFIRFKLRFMLLYMETMMSKLSLAFSRTRLLLILYLHFFLCFWIFLFSGYVSEDSSANELGIDSSGRAWLYAFLFSVYAIFLFVWSCSLDLLSNFCSRLVRKQISTIFFALVVLKTLFINSTKYVCIVFKNKSCF